MNRFFRRHKQDAVQDARVKTQRDLYAPGTPQDVTDPRAKSQRHKKTTADKWNQ
jgi:hypothetical protein